jgi:hypothetical protein
MIGPPGLPKLGRPVSYIAGSAPPPARLPMQAFKWASGLYLAGVLAHFSHTIVFNLPGGIDRSFVVALHNAPTSLAWPADLIGTLIALA